MKLRKQRMKKEKINKCFCSAVIPAAGSSSRMGGVDKLFAELNGVPVIVRTLRVMESCYDIDEVIIVTRDVNIPIIAELCREYNLSKVKKIVIGGDTRTESVCNGLNEVSPKAELAVIHDGARPFADLELIKSVIDAAKKYSAAAPGIKVKDTVKTVKNGFVETTPNREKLYAIQTPQVFDVDLIKGALSYATEKGLSLTDDCMAVEAMGGSVYIVEGSYSNIKITTPEDLLLGETICQSRGED